MFMKKDSKDNKEQSYIRFYAFTVHHIGLCSVTHKKKCVAETCLMYLKDFSAMMSRHPCFLSYERQWKHMFTLTLKKVGHTWRRASKFRHKCLNERVLFPCRRVNLVRLIVFCNLHCRVFVCHMLFFMHTEHFMLNGLWSLPDIQTATRFTSIYFRS